MDQLARAKQLEACLRRVEANNQSDEPLPERLDAYAPRQDGRQSTPALRPQQSPDY